LILFLEQIQQKLHIQTTKRQIYFSLVYFKINANVIG
jgi:hypothetical protein